MPIQDPVLSLLRENSQLNKPINIVRDEYSSGEMIPMRFNSIRVLSVFMLLAAVVLSAGCISASPDTNVVPPVSPATTATGSSGAASCGLTTCHGLDLACGANAPEICTMEYRLGDKCRQYARCDSSGGSCTLVTDPQFASCKACVEQCAAIKATTTDPAMVFECESKC
jgi:hypothetical protein